MPKSNTRKVVRSAKSGKFAKKSKAKTAPASHVTETVGAVPRSFTQELTALINKHSLERDSNTAGSVLAQYLDDCLSTFNRAMKSRRPRRTRRISVQF